MISDLGKLFRDELIGPEISARHEYHCSLGFVEPSVLGEGDELRWLDYLKEEARLLVYRTRQELKRSKHGDIVSARVRHSAEAETRDVVDFVTGEKATRTDTIHRVYVTFECTGEAPSAPRAVAKRVLGDWLLVDSVEHLECGQRIQTFEGERSIVVVDTECKLVKLSHPLRMSNGFEVYAVGDVGSEAAR